MTIPSEVEAVLRDVAALRGRAVAVAPLPGGLTNRNYRVEVDGEPFVVRIAGADTELLGIDRDREAACSRRAADLGIGPDVVAYLPAHRALVTRFARGRLLTEEDARRPDVLLRLAGALRHCHAAAAVGIGRFSVFDTVRDYVRTAAARGVSLPEALPNALTRLERIEESARGAETPCLCHNDLLPSNLIDDGSSVFLIDWEYAGVGDRFFDLGNLAVNLQLTPEQETTFLAAYSSEARPDDLRRLRRMRLASDLREAAWGFVQAAVSTLHPPAYYLDYGGRHLDRFLAGDPS